MTKHLRFLIVLLLTLVWSTGGAQTTIDFSNGLPTGWSKKGTIQKQTIDNKTCSQLQSSASVTSPAFEDAYSSMKISLTRSGNGTTFTISYQIGNASVVEFKTFKAADVAVKSWKDYIVNIPAAAQVANCKFIFKSTKASYYISSIEFTKAGPSKTPTKVAFPAEYSNKTFTFTEGKLEGFTAPKATETNNVAGTIKYSSNNKSAVTVDASTGALSFPGYGEATITATFTPKDADTYAESTDSYKVVNKADLSDFVFYESFDKCAGKGGNDGTFKNTGTDKVLSDNTGWSFTNEYGANKCVKLGTGSNSGSAETPAINLSGKGLLTFKVASWDGDNSEVNVSVNNGTLIYNGKEGKSFVLSPTDTEWNDINMIISMTGSVKVKFYSTNKRFFLDEVMVKDIPTVTLDETATNNNIVAKTGVNVTLKRSMKADMWNTICLPFEVSEGKAKTAFGDGVKIAVLDAKSSTGATLKFDDYTTLGIPAATPCLIKPSEVKTSNEYVFENVNIVADEPKYELTEGYLVFKGIYNMVDITKDVFDSSYKAAFLGANNTVFGAQSNTKMKGFRAYFAIPNSVKASELRVVIDGTATSIKNIDSEVVESNAPVYNLQGQRVDGNNLTPGIYVKAGKKFVVK